jgi:probable rRNA maturation factor
MDIHFHFADATIALTDRNRLKSFLSDLFKKERKKLTSLNYIFCSDEYLLDINRRFLNHDYYTDIITFNLSPDINKVEGELYISIDRIRDNALVQKTTIKEELHRVIFHGALHLCGYKDKTKTEIVKMRAGEEKCLATYFK